MLHYEKGSHVHTPILTCRGESYVNEDDSRDEDNGTQLQEWSSHQNLEKENNEFSSKAPRRSEASNFGLESGPEKHERINFHCS